MAFNKPLGRLITAFLSLNLMGSLHAETAHLNMQIKGLGQGNVWFLCMPHECGCMSMRAAAKGKYFPLNPGRIQQAYVLDVKHLKMHAQRLPRECAVQVKDNQTLTITGHLQTDEHHEGHIEQMHCHLIG